MIQKECRSLSSPCLCVYFFLEFVQTGQQIVAFTSGQLHPKHGVFRARTTSSFARQVIAVGIVCLMTSLATACPFCAKLGKTLSDEAAEAEFVAAGSLSNPQIEGKTDFAIATVLKRTKGPAEGVAVLSRYLPVARNEPVDRVVFADVIDTELDPFRIMAIRSPQFVPYLQEALKKTAEPPESRYGYFSRFLEHADQTIAIDAYQEFAKAPYGDVVSAAGAYDPDKLLQLIVNPMTPGDRVGLYGIMVGVAGRPKDAQKLRQLVEEPDHRRLNGIDGMLGGYCVLEPRIGCDYTLDLLCDPSNGFNLRYAAMEAIRFALLEIPDVDREHVFERLTTALAIPEISDLVVDELRKYEHWSALDTVLALDAQPAYDQAVVHRAVLRFALECPLEPASLFVKERRETDPALVKDVESSLKFEKQLQAQFGGPKAKKAEKK